MNCKRESTLCDVVGGRFAPCRIRGAQEGGAVAFTTVRTHSRRLDMKLAMDCLFLGDGCDSRVETYAVSVTERLFRRSSPGMRPTVYAGSAVAKRLGAPVRSPSRIFPGGTRLWEEWRLPDLAYAERADILLCPGCPMPRRALMPVVVVVADALPLVRDEPNSSPWHRTLRRRLPLSLARATLIAAPSIEVRDDLLAWNDAVDESRMSGSMRLRRLKRRLGVPEDGRRPIHGLAERIRVIPWGAEPVFSAEGERPGRAEGANRTAYVLLPVREGETRRFEMAIKAWFAAVIKNRLPHGLVLLAQPPGKNRLDRLVDFAANLGVGDRVRAIRPADLDEAAALFRHAAATLLPYGKGDCGVSLFRSLACGTPVAASGCASLARLCDSGPEALIMVGNADVAAWRIAVETLLLRPARQKIPVRVPGRDRHVDGLWAEFERILAEKQG